MHVVLKEVLGRNDIEQALQDYAVHICLTNEYIDKPEIVTEPLYKEKLVLVMHATHPLAHNVHIEMKDLTHEPFIVTSKGFQTRNNIIQAFEDANIHMNIRYDADRFETILTLVEAGIGISIIPRNYIGKVVPENLVIRELNSPSLERQVYLAYIRNRYRPPAIEALLQKMLNTR